MFVGVNCKCVRRAGTNVISALKEQELPIAPTDRFLWDA